MTGDQIRLTPDTAVRRFPRAWIVLLVLLTASRAGVLAQGEPTCGQLGLEDRRIEDQLTPIEIGVEKLEQGTWKPFECYLNHQLSIRDSRMKVKLRDGWMDDHFRALAATSAGPDGTRLNGAILAPFRYVVADVRFLDVELIARIRRGANLELDQALDPTDGRVPLPPPRSHFQSIIVMPRYAGVWPPAKDRKIKFAYSNVRSTSSFIYPQKLFREKGWLSPSEPLVTFVPELPEAAASQSWGIDPVAASSQDLPSLKELLDRLAKGTATFNVVGTNDSEFETYLSREQQSGFAIVDRSEPIPFDPLIVRRGSSPLLGDPGELRLLKEVFLSTQGISRAERDIYFKWHPYEEARPWPSGKVVFRRFPDIFDFVEARSEDYDDVRRTAVLGTGGAVVRLAISRHVHKAPERDLERYFNPLKRRLLGATKSTDRVFLDVEARPSTQLLQTVKDLRDGVLDLAELPAFHAIRAIGEGSSIVAVAGFRNRSGQVEHQYSYRIYSRTVRYPNEIKQTDRFACTTPDSSSGYHWPIHYLKEEGRLDPARADPRTQLLLTFDASGVFQALRDKLADHGFIAGFEYEKEIRERFPSDFLDGIHLVHEGPILNAVIVSAGGFCPRLDRYELKSTPRALGIAERLSLLQGLRDSVGKGNPNRNVAVVEAIWRAMREEASAGEQAQEGFSGYRPGEKADWDDLWEKYLDFYPSPAPLMVTALLSLFLATSGILILRGRRKERPEITTVRLDDERAKRVLNAAIQLACGLGEPKKRFADVFGGPEAFERLRGRLDRSVVFVLSLFDLKSGRLRQEVSDQTYIDGFQRLMLIMESEIKQPLDAFVVRIPADAEGRKESDVDWIKTTLDVVNTALDVYKTMKG